MKKFKRTKSRFKDRQTEINNLYESGKRRHGKYTMANATQLKGVAGVRLGAVSNIQPNEPEWGETLEYMIQRWCAEMGVPYLGRARIGHTQDNHLVPFGIA